MAARGARVEALRPEEHTVSEFFPFISFPGTAREAFAFYQDVFGGTLRLWTYGEFDMSEVPGFPSDIPDEAVANADLRGDLVTLSGGDDRSGTLRPLEGAPFRLTLTPDSLARARELAARLAEHGGSVEMPLAPAPWGDHYGEVRDRFGVLWAFNVPPEDG